LRVLAICPPLLHSAVSYEVSIRWTALHRVINYSIPAGYAFGHAHAARLG